MRVSSAYVKRQSDNLSKLTRAAGDTVKRAVDTMEGDALAMAVTDVSRAYSTLSAALTAEYYNGIRAASKVRSKFTASAISGFVEDAAASAAYAIIGEVADGKATVPLASLMTDLVSRYIRDASETCVRENARLDPAHPRYVIVPQGDACAFCQMRASLEYEYKDMDAAQSHDHCSCQPTPVFGNSTVQGYNASTYRARYDKAAEAYRSGDISEDLKQRIDRQRQLKGDDFKSTNAILMVMREQQGIT